MVNHSTHAERVAKKERRTNRRPDISRFSGHHHVVRERLNNVLIERLSEFADPGARFRSEPRAEVRFGLLKPGSPIIGDLPPTTEEHPGVALLLPFIRAHS
jgi:hypothetical protein